MTNDEQTEQPFSWLHVVTRWIGTFFDDDSFLPLSAQGPGLRPGDEPTMLGGVGKVDGNHVTLVAQPTLRPEGHGTDDRAVHRAINHATETGCPLLFLRVGDSHESSFSGSGITRAVQQLVELSGVVPLISVRVGASEPRSTVLDDLFDFRVTVGEVNDPTSSYTSRELEEACLWVQDLLSHLPQNNCEFVAVDMFHDAGSTGSLDGLVPKLSHEPYALEPLLDTLSDGAEVVWIGNARATALATAFTRIDGRAVGILANRTSEHGGYMRPEDARSAARFIQLCDAFNLPLLFLVDTPGSPDHWSVGDTSYAQLVHATATSTVPSITIILRRAHGLAGEIFGAKRLGVDVVLALPSASITAAGFHRETDARASEHLTDTQRAAAVQQSRDAAHDLSSAMGRGLIDHVVEPSHIVTVVSRWFSALDDKRRQAPLRKHGNPPL